MFGTLREFFMPFFSGRHARARGASALRPLCLTALIGLVIEFALGMIVNLYVMIPAADAHASYIQEIMTAPGLLTAHALIGLVLLAAAVLLLSGAIALRNGVYVTLVATGLGALLGAFAAGEVFVKNSSASASLSMAIMTGVALVCYISLQARLGAAVRQTPQPRQAQQARVELSEG